MKIAIIIAVCVALLIVLKAEKKTISIFAVIVAFTLFFGAIQYFNRPDGSTLESREEICAEFPKGKDWNLKSMKDTLSLAGLAASIAEALLLLLGFFNKDFISFTLLLFISDSLFAFYPFCGFSASRIYRNKKRTSKIFLMSISILISLGSLLLFVL